MNLSAHWLVFLTAIHWSLPEMALWASWIIQEAQYRNYSYRPQLSSVCIVVGILATYSTLFCNADVRVKWLDTEPVQKASEARLLSCKKKTCLQCWFLCALPPLRLNGSACFKTGKKKIVWVVQEEGQKHSGYNLAEVTWIGPLVLFLSATHRIVTWKWYVHTFHLLDSIRKTFINGNGGSSVEINES